MADPAAEPVRPEQLGIQDFASYALIIDARSPHEYAEDHVPGAINLPVVDDAQYAEVGTRHKDDKHSASETKADIARHRAMAAAHEAAAKCLEAGKGEAVCLKQLQAACKDLGIGKHCGMKHVH